MSDTASIGHNLPRLPEIIHPEVIRALIEYETAPLKERATELIGACKRFTEAFPTIETPEQDAKAAEMLAVVQRFTSKSGRVETARVALKAPILAADTAIGSLAKGPFAGIVVSVEAAASAISRASINYKQKVEKETREKARAEAKRLADEAAMAEQLASRGSSTVTMDDAIAAAEAADVQQKIANSKAANLTRTHGDGIGTTSLKYKRTFTTPHPNLVPRSLCVPSDALIRAFIGSAEDTHSAKDGWAELPDGRWSRTDLVSGCVVIDVPDLTVRK